ncbi:MAG: phosphotransferase [Pseudomonadota bacterium]
MLNTLIEREQKLAHWVAAQLPLSTPVVTLTPIASDAGFRRYFRFATPSIWLAVDAPPQTEDSRQFVALARYLSQHGVNTPKVFAADEAQGFLLVEDFGDDLLDGELNIKTVNELYGRVFNTLINLQNCPNNETLFPLYDQPLLHRELLIFSEWFAEKLLGYSFSPQDETILAQTFNILENSALEQPQTLVHRDFHSRNLILQTSSIGVIDFQGALWGACTYDLASLLRDCYVRWPTPQVKAWALAYRQQAISAGLLAEVSESDFLRWFDWIGLQRHIKVLGIFARLHLRDSKHHYLHDLPLVIRYVLEVSEQYPQFHAFAAWFKINLLPRIEQHAWYSDYQHAGDNA